MLFMTTDVLKATGGKRLRGREDLHFSGISIDSRSIRKGELFVAVLGDRFDGHDFCEEVLKKGALGVMVREGWAPFRESLFQEPGAEQNLISVPDTIRALQDLAHAHRMQYRIPIVAVTGTNGKTSTKEMIYSILSIGHHVFRSQGNLNNHIGVPLSLFGIGGETEEAVLEFGMSGTGEIHRLREIARPGVVVITNVSAAHLMALRTVEEVAMAKGEILEEMAEDGWAVLNRDDPRVYAMRGRVRGKVMTFGLEKGADVTAKEIHTGEDGTRFRLKHGGEESEVRLNIPGLHQVSNAMAAAAAAVVLGRPLSIIARGLSSYRPLAQRWETFRLLNGAVVINDAYNANPESMKAAIRTLKGLGPHRRNIAVLGDMLELGGYSEEAHRSIGRLVAESSLDILVTVGEHSAWIAEEAEDHGMNPKGIIRCASREDAALKLGKILKGNDRILLKASRKMGLERIAEELKNAGAISQKETRGKRN